MTKKSTSGWHSLLHRWWHEAKPNGMEVVVVGASFFLFYFFFSHSDYRLLLCSYSTAAAAAAAYYYRSFTVIRLFLVRLRFSFSSHFFLFGRSFLLFRYTIFLNFCAQCAFSYLSYVCMSVFIIRCLKWIEQV